MPVLRNKELIMEKITQHKRVEKTWGFELWLANTDLYCGKFLNFKKGASCSYHYHKEKHETFYVNAGSCRIDFGYGIELPPP